MAEVQALRPESSSGALVTLVVGKLLEQRRHEGSYYSVIVAPAPDAYSQPVPLEVRSDRSLGAQGEMVSVNCQVGGVRGRHYELQDKNTGEVRKVKPIRVTLDALN